MSLVVIPHATGIFKVLSGPKSYWVNLNADEQPCDCDWGCWKDWRDKGINPCKHYRACLEHLRGKP